MPQGIAVNSEGNVYEADTCTMNHMIQVFDPEGEYLFKFGKMASGIGYTPSPSALIIDKDDSLYVSSGTCSIYITVWFKRRFINSDSLYNSDNQATI